MSTPLRLRLGTGVVKRNTVPELFQARVRDRMIRAAFLQLTGALRARPEGARVTFENAARADNPSTPWRIDQGAIRSVAQAAAKGTPIEVTETRNRIRAYFAAREADALSFLPPESDESLVASVLSETMAQGPADVAAADLLAKPTWPAAPSRSRPLPSIKPSTPNSRDTGYASDVAQVHDVAPLARGIPEWREGSA